MILTLILVLSIGFLFTIGSYTLYTIKNEQSNYTIFFKILISIVLFVITIALTYYLP